MKKFRFSLQSIREIREAQEQAAQRAYGDATRECESAVARLMVLEEDLRGSWQTMRNWSGLRVDELRHGRAWCCVLEEKQKELTADVSRAQRKVDETHAQLVAATRRRESMDRLFRKQHSVHQRNVLVEEQKFLDELATRRAWRPELEAA
jgi:flagellar FliJ protein